MSVFGRIELLNLVEAAFGVRVRGFSTFGIDWYHLGHSLPAGWVAEGAAGVGAQREHHLAGARLDAELDCRFFVELLPGRNLQ